MKTPDRWIELVVKPYPSGSATVYRWAERAMAFPYFIEGRVLKNGWSDVEHALSDWKGNPEAAVLQVELNDTDGEVRALIASIGTSAYARIEATAYLLSEAGRKANLRPRIIQRGFVSFTPQPRSRRKASLSIVDVTGSHFYNLSPESMLQRVVWTREFLTLAGLTNTPKSTLAKPLNIVINEHSDAGSEDAAGNNVEKGMIPPDDLGDMVISSSNVVVTDVEHVEIIPPPVLSVEYVGTASGPYTYYWAVSLITATGESATSNVVSLSGMPAQFDASNYARLTWAAPAGWEAVYASVEVAYKVFGRDSNPVTTRLDLMNNGATWVNPEHEYHDDQDHDVEKPDNPLSVGTAKVTTTTPGDPTTVTQSTAYGVFAVSAGYAPINKVFGSNLAPGAVPGRTDVTDQVIRPTDGAWPFPQKWLELAHPDGGTVRVTAFLVQGPLLNQARAGSVTFAVDTCGMLDTGDDTGVPITEASVGYAFVLNFIMKNNGQGYRTGAHWPLEQFSNGETIVNTDKLNAFRDKGIKFLGGTGFKFHFAATKPMTLSQFQQHFSNSFTCYTGALDNGQEALFVIDPDTDLAGAARFVRNRELGPWLEDAQVADDEVENRGWFAYDYDPDADAYRGDPELVFDLPSQAMYGVRDVVAQTDGATVTPLEMRCTRDQATARDAMARRIFLNKVAPVYQPMTTPLMGMETNVGDVILVTHVDGIGEDGYVDHPFFVVRKKITGVRPNLRVILTARDVNRFVAASDSLTDSASADAGATLPFILGA